MHVEDRKSEVTVFIYTNSLFSSIVCYSCCSFFLWCFMSFHFELLALENESLLLLVTQNLAENNYTRDPVFYQHKQYIGKILYSVMCNTYLMFEH